MQAQRTERRQPTGFTLVELMVVIGLMGILAALIVPEMRGTYGDALLRSGARSVTEVCAIASARAVSFQQPHRVQLDSATGRFRVERRAGGRGADAVFVPVRDTSGCEGQLGGGITLRVRTPEGAGGGWEEAAGAAPFEAVDGGAVGGERGARWEVGFYPDGTADAAEILLRDADGFELALRVHPVTGRVQVIEGPGRDR